MTMTKYEKVYSKLFREQFASLTNNPTTTALSKLRSTLGDIIRDDDLSPEFKESITMYYTRNKAKVWETMENNAKTWKQKIMHDE